MNVGEKRTENFVLAKVDTGFELQNRGKLLQATCREGFERTYLLVDADVKCKLEASAIE